MADKSPSDETAAAGDEAGGREAVEELQQLVAEETVEIKGQRLSVREFTFRQGLEAAPVARPIIQALQELVTAEGEEADAFEIADLMAAHPDAWFQLVARACDCDPEWVAGLPETEGMHLSLVFWRLNAAFFMRRVVTGAMRKAGEATAGEPASYRSSTP